MSVEDEANKLFQEAKNANVRVHPLRVLELLMNAARLFRRAGNLQSCGDCLNDAGLILNQLRRFKEADLRFAEAIDAYQAVGEKRRIALVLTNQGVSLRDRGESQKAVERFERSIALYRIHGDEEDLAGTLTRLSNLCLSIGMNEHAAHALEEAERLYYTTGNYAERARALLQLGIALTDSLPNRAEKLFKESIEVAEKAKKIDTWSMALISLSELLKKTNRIDEAIHHLRKVLGKLRDMDDPGVVCNALLNLGSLLEMKGDEDAAIESWEEAHQIYESIGDKVRAVWTLGHISSLLAKRIEEFQKAFDQMSRGDTSLNDIIKLVITSGKKDEPMKFKPISIDTQDEAIELAYMIARAGNLESLQQIVYANVTKFNKVFFTTLCFNLERALEKKERERAHFIEKQAKFIVDIQKQTLRFASTLAKELIQQDRNFIVHIEPGVTVSPIEGNEKENRATVEALYQDGLELVTKKKPREAFKRFKNSMEFFEHLNDKPKMAECLVNLGNCALNYGDLELAFNYLNKALELFGKLNDHAGSKRILSAFGLLEQKRGRFKDALQYFHQAYELARQMNNQKAEASAMTNIGAMYQNLEQNKEALYWQEKALELNQKLGKSKTLATNLANLADLYRNMGQISKSDKLMAEAQKIIKTGGDDYQLVLMLHNQAVEEFRNKSLVHAESLLQEARAIAVKTKDPYLEVRLLESLLGVLREKGDLKNMEKVFKRFNQIHKKLGHIEGHKKILLFRAQIAMTQGAYTDAVDACKELLSNSSDQLDTFEKIPLFRNLAELLSKLGDINQSTHYYAKLKEIIDPIINSDVDDSNRQLYIMSCKVLASLVIQQQLDLDFAIKAVDRGIEIATNTQLMKDISELCEEKASLLRYAGRHLESLESHRHALQITTESNDERLKALILGNMATTLRELGNLSDAEESYREALEIINKLNIYELKPQILQKLAAVIFDLGRFDEVKRLHKESAEISKNLGDRTNEANALIGMAGVALAQNKPKDAERLINKVFKFGEVIPRDIHTEALIVLAFSLRMQKRIFEAVHNIEKALFIGKSTNSDKAALFFYAGVIQNDAGNPKLALEFLNKAQTILGDIMSPLTAKIRLWRGDIYRSLGDLENAQNEYEIALKYLEHLRGHVRYEQDRFSFIGDLATVPEALTYALLRQNQKIDAFAVLESAKSRSFIGRLGFGELPTPHSVPMEKQEEEEKLRKRIQSKEQAIQNSKTDPQRKRFMKELGDLLKAYNVLINAISEYAPDYVEWRHGKTVTFDEVKSMLY